MVSRFSQRDIVTRPSCPFCGAIIERPRELTARMPNELPVGACECGAVYACDVTGHNLGTAMIDALVFGCNGDWDLAWDLLPDEDYLEEVVKNYDYEGHLIVHGGAYKGRSVSGVLYFIRLQEDIREVTEDGFRKQLSRAPAPSPDPPPPSKRGGKAFTKKEVETLVREYRMEDLLALAREDKRIIRDLLRLLYAVDDLLRLRAAEALGRVSALIARNDPGTISKLLQNLFTAISDTAASSWGALDAIGEIIACSPGQFGAYIPQLYRFTGDRTLLEGVLRVLGRIGAASPDLLRKTAFRYIPLLRDPDPAIRGYTALLLGNLGAREALEDLRGLLEDPAQIQIYHQGAMMTRTVGKLASEAVEKI